MGHAGFGALHSNGVGGCKARTFTMLGQAAHQREDKYVQRYNWPEGVSGRVRLIYLLEV